MDERNKQSDLKNTLKQWVQLRMLLLAALGIVNVAIALRAGCLSLEAMDMLLDVQRHVIVLKQEVDNLKKDGIETNNANPNNSE